MPETLKPIRWEHRKSGKHETWMKSFPKLGIYGHIRKIDARFFLVFMAEHWTGGKEESEFLFQGDTPTLESAKRTVDEFAKEARERGVSNVGKRKRAGNPHPKADPSKRKRGGYRVCVRTVANGWATWTKDKATGLSGPEADRLMRKLNRAGYQVAKFQGRTKVK